MLQFFLFCLFQAFPTCVLFILYICAIFLFNLICLTVLLAILPSTLMWIGLCLSMFLRCLIFKLVSRLDWLLLRRRVAGYMKIKSCVLPVLGSSVVLLVFVKNFRFCYDSADKTVYCLAHQDGISDSYCSYITWVGEHNVTFFKVNSIVVRKNSIREYLDMDIRIRVCFLFFWF